MATKPFALEAERQLGPIYFDCRAGNYWLQIPSGRYLNLSASDVKLHLRDSGMFVDETGANEIKNGDRALLRAQLDRPIDYAGPLSGYPIGAYTVAGGKKILVTHQAEPLVAVQGDTPGINKLFDELLGAEQSMIFFLWLKFARESLLKRDFRPRQLMAMCGPSGCGKSLAQSFVTEMLGGRVGKPYPFMSGQTNFNADLCEAEHWCIEDEAGTTDIRTRRAFGQAIKQAAVNSLVWLHGKGQKGLTVPVYKALTATLNSESENLLIMPPMDESIVDKIILLKCSPVSTGKGATITGDREKDWKKFKKELPGLAWEVDNMLCPRELASVRYGVTHFQHPDLFERLADMSQESRLLEFIDQFLWDKKDDKDGMPWRGSATDLELALRDTPAAYQVDRLLHFPNAAGTYLSRLASRIPDRFDSVKNRGKTIWLIKKSPPEKEAF